MMTPVRIGSLFYAIYFFVSFPMFYRIDEYHSAKHASKVKNMGWTLSEIVLDSLAAGMIVTIILDLWRLFLGPLIDPNLVPKFLTSSDTLPWL